MSAITRRLPRLGLLRHGTHGDKFDATPRPGTASKPKLTEDEIRALYRLADSLPEQEAAEVYRRLDAHFNRHAPGRHQRAVPRGTGRPRPYATGQPPERPRLRPLPPRQPGFAGMRAADVLEHLAKVPYPDPARVVAGDPRGYEDTLRIWSRLTNTEGPSSPPWWRITLPAAAPADVTETVTIPAVAETGGEQ